MESSRAHLADPVAERVAAKVRAALAESLPGAGMDEAVEAAREAMISAEAVSLFGLATDHPEHGSVHWLVGQAGEEEAQSYVVLALTAASDGGEHGLHAVSAADLSEALLRLAPEFGHVEAPGPLPA